MISRGKRTSASRGRRRATAGADEDFRIVTATAQDAPALAAIRVAVAERLTRDFGKGHWSSAGTERGVLRGITTARVLVARRGSTILGSLRLETKKPWAIDVAYFTRVPRPIYLLDMMVHPSLQRQGVGRRLLVAAEEVAKAWPAQAIRLDAYNHAAGAGDFYARSGFREVGRVTYRGVPLIYFERLL
ncbi:MAG: GNAT family N-acetyltransferase [Candidatus Eiseniibacteriota bacterium]